MSRPLTWLGRADLTSSAPSHPGDAPMVSLADVNEIELLILKRMREFTVGEHASLFHGSGFDFTGLREWQAGDRLAAIDWPQSSLTNFSPLVVREYDQPSTSGVMIVADDSTSTRARIDGVPMATIIARAIATLGMSAVFFQDAVGLITMGNRGAARVRMRPRIGKNHVMQCLEAYTARQSSESAAEAKTVAATIAGSLRRASLVPVVSDFLFDDAPALIRDLAALNNRHDVFIALVDAAPAFDLPRTSARWMSVADVETGRTRVVSRGEARRMSQRVRGWQDGVAAEARGHGLDVVRLELDATRFDLALAEFVIGRRLRRKTA